MASDCLYTFKCVGFQASAESIADSADTAENGLAGLEIVTSFDRLDERQRKELAFLVPLFRAMDARAGHIGNEIDSLGNDADNFADAASNLVDMVADYIGDGISVDRLKERIQRDSTLRMLLEKGSRDAGK